jgi:DNA (cytosine-5)-methyltransferase 1
MGSTLVDTKQAASLLNLTPQQVGNLCRNGKLRSQKIGGAWVIDKDEITKHYDRTSCGVAENHTSYYTNKEIIKNKKPIALSFFSGAMGLDLGIEEAGFEVLLTCEIDNSCRKTIIKNRPKIALLKDVRDYDAEAIRKEAGLKPKDDIDLIVGGPPCQAFSTAGKRKGFEDDRGNVFLVFLERILELKPKFAVLENVRGILSAPLKHRPHNERGPDHPPLTSDEENGGALMHILNILRKAGYGISFNLYNSANFGTPQKRERVIMLCSRDGQKLPYLTPTHAENGEFNLPKWRSFRSAVKGLKKNNHHHLNFPEKRLRYYRQLKSGQYWKHLAPDLQKEALGASYYAGGGKTGFLRRLAWDKPSPTLVTHPTMPATDLAHPSEDRPLSIEEYKRIQEFSDIWLIEGSLIEQYKQVGNAVPRSLGRAVGKHIIDYMTNKKIPEFPGFQYSRYKHTDETSWEEQFHLRMKKNNKSLQLPLAI